MNLQTSDRLIQSLWLGLLLIISSGGIILLMAIENRPVLK